MSKIEERVVSMKFTNSQFLNGIKSTLRAIDTLKRGLTFKESVNNMGELNAAAQKVDLTPMGRGVDGISGKFAALATVAITALSNITNRAIDMGAQLAKSFTIQPITDGFAEYELKMGSVQTIMNGSGESMERVNAKLDELNTYADRTIYSFSDMTSSIGKFTNAGVDLDTSVAAIQGISNVAALAGANSNDASRAMYNFSQALSQGSVRLQDWMSIETANMATAGFREELIKSAVAAGTLEEAGDGVWKTLEGTEVTVENFRNTLQDQWLTADTLTDTLGKYADETTELGKNAFAAAQDVKSFTQMMDTLKEAAGSGWAQSWELVIGDFEQAKEVWTAASNTLGGVLEGMSERRNKMLKDWADAGGRDDMIRGIASAFEALSNIIRPIKGAFDEIFPPMTGQRLAEITKSIADFMGKLTLSGDAMIKVHRIFAGLFAVVDIGLHVLKMVAGVLKNVFGAATSGSTGILELAASIGDFLVRVRDAIKSGEGLQKVFNKISYYLVFAAVKLNQFVSGLVSFISGLDIFKSFDLGPVGDGLDRVGERVKPLTKLGRVLSAVWSGVASVFGGVWKALREASGILGDMFGALGEGLQKSLANFDFSLFLDTINTGALLTAAVAFKKFLGGFGGEDNGGPGIFDTIKDGINKITGTFGALTDTLGEMQTTLKVGQLVLIAAAVGILTASVVALSLIDSKKLGTALAAITAMFLQLSAAMMILNATSITGSLWKLPAMGAAMILLAIGIRILAGAVRQLSDLEWEELAKGLTGVIALVVALTASTNLMAKNSKGMISAGLGLIIIAAAIRILVSAVTSLAGLGWDEMAKGLVGVGALLASLAIFSKLAAVNKGAVAQGAGLILLATALKILASVVGDFAEMSWTDLGKGVASIVALLAALAIFSRVTGNAKSILASGAAMIVMGAALKIMASAVQDFSGMSWNELAKGLTGMGVAIGVIATALTLMPKSTVISAVAITIVAAALKTLAEVLNSMGGMSWEEIAKGLTTLAGSLVIIAAAMALMTGALAGAAALIVVSAALSMLAPVLLIFSQMSWGEMLTGLGMLAGVFVVLGVAGLVLAPVVPVLMLLGVAIGLLGIAMLAAGAGVFLFSTGLAALAVSGAAGAAALVGIISTMLSILPMIVRAIGETLIQVAQVIAISAPAIVQAITVVISALLQMIITLTPQILHAFEVILRGILGVIARNAGPIVAVFMHLLDLLLAAAVNAIPKITRAGLDIIIGFLTAIRDKVPEIVPIAADIITNFLDSIANALPDIIESGVNLIISFIEGCAQAIRNNSDRMNQAGLDLASALVSGMVNGIADGAGLIADAARNAASRAWEAAKDFLRIRSPSKKFYELGRWSDEGFANGLSAYSGVVAKEATGVGKDAIFAMKKSIAGISDVLGNEMDLNPRITPVLDLTDVSRNAAGLDRMLGTKTISVQDAYIRSRKAQEVERRNRAALAEEAAKAVEQTKEIKFEQNNYSPKALSRAEIYRQTRNQLSVVREEFA